MIYRHTFKKNSYDEINTWVADKCSPLVREITFENAEELTEEGLPFLILFHKPEDNESVKQYSEVVQKHLLEDKRKNMIHDTRRIRIDKSFSRFSKKFGLKVS